MILIPRLYRFKSFLESSNNWTVGYALQDPVLLNSIIYMMSIQLQAESNAVLDESLALHSGVSKLTRRIPFFNYIYYRNQAIKYLR